MSDSRLFSILTLLLVVPASLSVHGANSGKEYPTTEISTPSLHCWQEEEFSILTECARCNPFQMKSWAPCARTGFIENINCAKSNKVEYKSCRSSRMDESLFWRFEGIMMCLTVVLVLVVIARQRTLDHLASEKVSRQILSI
ncbi:JTB protein precursor [Salmo salar]|uniref:Protein JTB n=1 Tax=Salmo salar TaxID=8030 RepID=B5XGC2_SALSA|nr:JTB protein precursor [Salmo salar]ACI69892.1 JTB precursor [Salmo salar]|eukprot:NP_001135018.1 JTB protein precursor [Salmo salar]